MVAVSRCVPSFPDCGRVGQDHVISILVNGELRVFLVVGTCRWKSRTILRRSPDPERRGGGAVFD